MIDQLPGPGDLDHRLAAPVLRYQTVTNMGVKCRAGTRSMVVVIGTLMGIRRLEQRKEPVPVKQRKVCIRIGRWMPAEEMVVMLTHLARTVVMPNVVIVGLG